MPFPEKAFYIPFPSPVVAGISSERKDSNSAPVITAYAFHLFSARGHIVSLDSDG